MTCKTVSRMVFIWALAVMSATYAYARDWQLGQPLNIPRTGLAACADACGNIYAVGGETSSGVTNTVERFDGSTWSLIASLNVARRHPAVVCVNGFIYVIGGQSGAQNSSALATVERLDTTVANYAWIPNVVPPMNAARFGARATVDALGRIWVIGGENANGQELATAEIYDPARPTLCWQTGPPLQVARFLAGVVTDLRGRIYAIGGANDAIHLSSVERIDPCDISPTWTTLTSIPSMHGISDAADCATGADGRIYHVGGWLPGFTNRVVRYDPDADSWQLGTPLQDPRNTCGITVDRNGRIFTIGGGFGTNPLGSVEIMDGPCGAGDAKPRLLDVDANHFVNVDDLLNLINTWGNCR